MPSTVSVAILKIRKFGSREVNIRKAFSDPFFDVHYIDGKRFSHVDALDKLKQSSSQDHCIVVTDNMTTTFKPSRMKKYILSVIKSMKDNDTDVCYLHRYMDKCQMLTECHSEQDFSLSRTRSPFGEECILFSPKARDMVLGGCPLRNGKKFRIRSTLSKALHKGIKRRVSVP